MWALALGLLTCLSIDASNPLLPGVVRFNDSESVYALRAERPRMDEQAAVLIPAAPTRQDDRLAAPARTFVAVPEPLLPDRRLVRPRGGNDEARTTPGNDEDH